MVSTGCVKEVETEVDGALVQQLIGSAVSFEVRWF